MRFTERRGCTRSSLYDNKTRETSGPWRRTGSLWPSGMSRPCSWPKDSGWSSRPTGTSGRIARHRTNIPGVYAAGDVEGGYKQIVTATGQGAAAAMTIFEDLIHPYWNKAQG